MKIKRHYLTADEIPAEARAFYTQQGGAWELELEEGAGGEGGGARMDDGKGTPPDAGSYQAVPREQMTLRQVAAAQAAEQSLLRMQAEVRTLAQQLGATPKGVEAMLQRAQERFRVVGGRVQAMGTDGRTLLRAADGGGVLTVAEWARRQVTASPELFAGRADSGGDVEAELPARNPFKRRHGAARGGVELRPGQPQELDADIHLHFPQRDRMSRHV